MDDTRFDGMARVLGVSKPRRGALGLLAALGIGLAVGGAEAGDARRKRKRKNRNRRNRNRHPITCPAGQIRCGDFCYPECCPTDSRPCYSGPAATRNVGVCRDGSEYCLLDGRWGSVCWGDVTPGAETCNGLDDDCDGVVDGESANTSCGLFHECVDGGCLPWQPFSA